MLIRSPSRTFTFLYRDCQHAADILCCLSRSTDAAATCLVRSVSSIASALIRNSAANSSSAALTYHSLGSFMSSKHSIARSRYSFGVGMAISPDLFPCWEKQHTEFFCSGNQWEIASPTVILPVSQNLSRPTCTQRILCVQPFRSNIPARGYAWCGRQEARAQLRALLRRYNRRVANLGLLWAPIDDIE